MKHSDTFVLTAVITLSFLVAFGMFSNQGYFSLTSLSVSQPKVVPGGGGSGTGEYIREIQIDNSLSTQSLSNYQIKITFDTASLITQAKMNADCSNLRFYDSDQATLINHWIESGCNTASTKIWIKVPSIPSNSAKNIYMNYGFASTVSTNPDNVFDLYDGFSGTSLNTAKWQSDGSVTVAGGTVTLNNNIRTVSSYSGNIIADVKMKYSDNSARLGTTFGSSQRGSFLFVRGGVDTTNWNTYEGSSWGSEELMITAAPNTYYIWRHFYRGTSVNSEFLDTNYVSLDTSSTRTVDAPQRTLWIHIYPGGTSQITADYVMIRKYTTNEPSVTVGPEQGEPTGLEVPSLEDFIGESSFKDDYQWCTSICNIAGTQNAQSTIPYSYSNGYENLAGANWRVGSDIIMGNSLRSGPVDHDQSSKMIFNFSLPQLPTQNAVYSLSFDYMISAESSDRLVVHLTKKTGPQAGPLDLAYAQGVQCLNQGGDRVIGGNQVDTRNTYNQITSENNPCTYLMAGEYTLDITYYKDATISLGQDAAFIDNLKIHLIPLL